MVKAPNFSRATAAVICIGSIALAASRAICRCAPIVDELYFANGYSSSPSLYSGG